MFPGRLLSLYISLASARGMAPGRPLMIALPDPRDLVREVLGILAAEDVDSDVLLFLDVVRRYSLSLRHWLMQSVLVTACM